MGQTLSSPVTQKHTNTGEDERYIYGVSEMQGWRISMEDAHATILDLDEEGLPDKNAFFAVYDGHGGATVARFAGRNVHKRLTAERAYHEKHYDAALKKAFLGTDEDIRADPSFFHDPSGCTAVAALLTSDRKLYVANAGDSRSIISVKGEAKPLSYDHKPQNETEVSRITAAGGYIEYGRVNGNLALSRAIGDFEFKKNYALAPERQIITANPDIIVHELTDEDEFLVLACDGIWDCLSSQQVVDSVRRLIHDGLELTEICESLMDMCLAPPPPSTTGIGSDNMTVVVIALLNGRSKEEWYAWVKDRVAQQYGYDTPVSLPQVFSPMRRGMAGAQRNFDEPNGAGIRIPAGGLGGLARAFANGPISFHPGGNENEDNALEFERYDSDEDESDEDIGASSSFLNSLRRSKEDVTKFLLAQLEEERDGMNHLEAGGSSRQFERDGDMDVSEPDEAESTAIQRILSEVENKNLKQGEAPLPPLDSKSNEEQPQLIPQPPSGDEPSGAVKVEGLMDASESPFKMG
ncbi:phosphatase 2C-like domain-containing protein [Gautieria morchelliformis]|nr:phosphatase 2C-like domain-containing protein [Gautieria morchelliformis]